MATATFDDILAAQRETNELLGRQRSPLDGRTGAGKALLDAQKATTSALGSVIDGVGAVAEGVANPPPPPKKDAGEEESLEKARRSFLVKTFGKFGNKIDNGFKALAAGLQKFKDVATGGFKAFLIAAGLLALAKFLRSSTWKKIRKLIEGNPLVGVLGAVTALVAVLFPLRTISAITKTFKLGGVLLAKFGVFAKDIFAPFRAIMKLRPLRLMRVFFKKTLPNAFKGLTFKGIGDLIKGSIKGSIKGFGNSIKGLGGLLKSVIFAPLTGLIVLIEGVGKTFFAVMDRLKETGGNAMEALQTGAATFAGVVVGAIPDLIKSLISFILKIPNMIIKFFTGEDSAILTGITGFLDSFDFTTGATEILEKLIDGATMGLTNLIEAVMTFDYSGAIKDAIDGVKNKFFAIQDIIGGTIDAAIVMVQDAFDGVVQGIKNMIMNNPLVKLAMAASSSLRERLSSFGESNEPERPPPQQVRDTGYVDPAAAGNTQPMMAGLDRAGNRVSVTEETFNDLQRRRDAEERRRSRLSPEQISAMEDRLATLQERGESPMSRRDRRRLEEKITILQNKLAGRQAAPIVNIANSNVDNSSNKGSSSTIGIGTPITDPGIMSEGDY